jgi:hypothetical protein
MILRAGQYTPINPQEGRSRKTFSAPAGLSTKPLSTDCLAFILLLSRIWRRLRMRRKPKKRKIGKPKARLGLPDLDQSKAAVIGSLRSPESQRGNTHAIDEFNRMVLFGTAPLVQSDGRTAVPH